MSDRDEPAQAEASSDLLPGEDMKFGDAAEAEAPEKPEPADEPAVEAGPKDDAAAEQPADPEQSEEKPERKRESAKERRERLRQKYQREVDEAQAKAEDARRRADQIKRAGESEAEPKSQDFPTYDDYIAAKAVWAYARQNRAALATQVEQEATAARQAAEDVRQQERAMLAQHWQEQKVQAAQKYADFEEVVLRPGLFPTDNHLADLIIGSENAADLAYRVAQDQSLHDRLVEMHPYEAARELGRLEATLSAPPHRVETQAPQPISPVRPKASASADPAKMSYADYVAGRRAGRIK